MPTLAELRGLWRRSMIQYPDGMDDTTEVYWLQSQSVFIDLRQPEPARNYAHVRSLDDLSPEDCAWLARQQGFAGFLSTDGAFFEWSRRIDFQPTSALADAGSLHWDGAILVEHGRYQAYVEHWHRAPPPPSQAVSNQDAGLMLRESDGGAAGAFVRIGHHFMLARARTAPLPAASTLSECLEGASTASARAFIDCEISYGTICDEVYTIACSTLPFRVATQLRLARTGSALLFEEQPRDGAEKRVKWDIIEGSTAI